MAKVNINSQCFEVIWLYPPSIVLLVDLVLRPSHLYMAFKARLKHVGMIIVQLVFSFVFFNIFIIVGWFTFMYVIMAGL